MKIHRYGLILAAVLVVQAQAADTQPAATTQPAGQAMSARIIELTGNVSYALVDANGTRGEWRTAKVGDLLPGGTRIRTQLRSRVSLAFGDSTVVVIERATLASIDDFRKTPDANRVRLALGHGTIRGSAAETTLRSDLTIETPTATLSKRGTRDFGISYEPGTGRFRIWLAGDGLVEALSKLSGQQLSVRPGEYVTQAMLRWIETATLDRWVPIVDTFGTTDMEKMFHALNDSGMAVVEPGGGTPIWYIIGPGQPGVAADQATRRSAILNAPIVVIPGPRFVARPEGNFGTGVGAGSTKSRAIR